MHHLLAFLASAALVAALPQSPTPVFYGTTASSGTPTASVTATITGSIVLPSPTCVTGTPTRVGEWDINYAVERPSLNAGYAVLRPAWFDSHKLSVQGWDGLGQDFYAYAEFKCQYECNALQGCVSFIGRNATRGFECVFFDALIEQSLFTGSPRYAIGTISHAFNKLCRVTKRDTVLGKDAKWTRCNGEFCCTDDVACPITSDCAELGLIDVKPDEGWSSYYLDGDWITKNRWAAFVQEGEFTGDNEKYMETQCKIACIKNLNKCSGFIVGFGFPDPENGYPGFIPSFEVGEKKQGFICNLLSKKIDKTMYREATKEGTWTHFRGVDIGCTSPLIK